LINELKKGEEGKNLQNSDEREKQFEAKMRKIEDDEGRVFDTGVNLATNLMKLLSDTILLLVRYYTKLIYDFFFNLKKSKEN